MPVGVVRARAHVEAAAAVEEGLDRPDAGVDRLASHPGAGGPEGGREGRGRVQIAPQPRIGVRAGVDAHVVLEEPAGLVGGHHDRAVHVGTQVRVGELGRLGRHDVHRHRAGREGALDRVLELEVALVEHEDLLARIRGAVADVVDRDRDEVALVALHRAVEVRVVAGLHEAPGGAGRGREGYERQHRESRAETPEGPGRPHLRSTRGGRRRRWPASGCGRRAW